MSSVVSVLIVIAVIAFLGVYLWWQSEAKKTHGTVVPLNQQAVADLVRGSFNGVLWKDVPGPGHINKKRRALRGEGATVSVDIEPAAQGGTEVSTWMSAWRSRYGFASFGGAAYRQKKRLLKRVDEALQEVPTNIVSVPSSPAGASTGPTGTVQPQGLRPVGGVPMRQSSAQGTEGNQRVQIADPGLHENDDRQLLYTFLSTWPLAAIFYGPLPAEDLLDQVLHAASAFRRSEPFGISFMHMSEPGMVWAMTENSRGAAILMFMEESKDSTLFLSHVLKPLESGMKAPVRHTMAGNGAVEREVAEYLDRFDVVEPWELPAMKDLRPADATTLPLSLRRSLSNWDHLSNQLYTRTLRDKDGDDVAVTLSPETASILCLGYVIGKSDDGDLSEIRWLEARTGYQLSWGEGAVLASRLLPVSSDVQSVDRDAQELVDVVAVALAEGPNANGTGGLTAAAGIAIPSNSQPQEGEAFDLDAVIRASKDDNFDPGQASAEHLKTIDSLVQIMNPIYESDESEALKPSIPHIVASCQQLVREDPRLIRFVQDINGMATRGALGDWAHDTRGGTLGEQGWSQLGEKLVAAFPGVDLVREDE
ncbi:hypothetical protein [Leekyejoonella antrihumi]|uniref:Uncharacterized protein n=1 Tax=Leekyejoonella antrihumi TaxID=1660198 RepID=A0A563DS53_9MICO|nr:hypothetical protein [Leekyejoonella antrihumi]TWP32999.1 hypothetical protein FGL98_22655 [Leekyejoonella antrihumi]